MADVTVLKTARLYEADMLANELEQANVPHYRRQETFAGLQLAMPAMAAPGLGTFFTVIVPDAAEQQAREILQQLPVNETRAGLWDFSPKPWARTFITVFAVLFLVLFVFTTVSQAVGWL